MKCNKDDFPFHKQGQEACQGILSSPCLGNLLASPTRRGEGNCSLGTPPPSRQLPSHPPLKLLWGQLLLGVAFFAPLQSQADPILPITPFQQHSKRVEAQRLGICSLRNETDARPHFPDRWQYEQMYNSLEVQERVRVMLRREQCLAWSFKGRGDMVFFSCVTWRTKA